MAIDPKKWTTKTTEAIAAAGDQTRANGNPEVLQTMCCAHL